MAKMVTNDMKFPKPSIMIAAMCMAAGLSALQSQEEKPKAKAPRQATSNQLLMRDKLAQMNRILEGITLGDFDQVEKSARTLGMSARRLRGISWSRHRDTSG